MTREVQQMQEVCCADVYPVRCNVALRASSDQALIDRVRAHGASVHGYTPVWYSRERIAAITEASNTHVLRSRPREP